MQARYAQAKVENLARRLLDKSPDNTFETGPETDWKIETVAAMREMIRYINMLEQKLDRVEVSANRRRMF